jgi:chaperonin GroES
VAKTKKKSPAKKSAKAPAKKPAVKKAAAKKPAAKKASPKKLAVKKPTAKKPVKKTAAKQPMAKKAAASKAQPANSHGKAVAAKFGKSAKDLTAALAKFVTPLDDRMIVQLKPKAEKTAGGLYIPDTSEDVTANIQGTVLAVGRGHRGAKGRILPMDVQIGDQVLFADHSGSKIFIQNEELVIIRESDVMGIVS